MMMALAEAGMLVVGALTPVVRRHNWRPRVSATGTAPAKLAWLVLSTLAATVSGLSYQIVQSGTCESAGGVYISSYLAECTAAGEALSAGLPVAFVERDVLSAAPLPPPATPLVEAGVPARRVAHTALHACGGLHRRRRGGLGLG